MPDVKCSVSNCHYWAEGNHCAADAIMVKVDDHTNSYFKTEFANDMDQQNLDKGHAVNNRGTLCETFRKKESQ
ncbi:DUF1540 domain-containing protein [Rubeoparvulum massiliense]|uniref:DUF1540 domain-containing protein n=1 Tax=Rubeoparvulum massiliense TaxID=1631346 RepID=UPI00065DC154|nr:DUF1540 domain-containing protein [Rubeoparvulum massiliense]